MPSVCAPLEMMAGKETSQVAKVSCIMRVYQKKGAVGNTLGMDILVSGSSAGAGEAGGTVRLRVAGPGEGLNG
jgi:hypothetical protein